MSLLGGRICIAVLEVVGHGTVVSETSDMQQVVTLRLTTMSAVFGASEIRNAG